MSEIDKIIIDARAAGASDVHISQGMKLMFRIHGALNVIPCELCDEEISDQIRSMLDQGQVRVLDDGNDVDFGYNTPDGNRQRVNIFRQQDKLCATIRLLNSSIPSLSELGLPSVLTELVNLPRGLILVTGPTGSGKSTTLASMIDYVNISRAEHIITIEDPVEYIYEQKRSLIHQREVGRDVASFAGALRSSLREDPDIILVGEMRDYETISAALTAAETGHLVLSTLHTTGASQTVDRIIDACPTNAQGQIRIQLSTVLGGIITQCLIPTLSRDGRVVATEVLTGTSAALNLIRENKCYQLNTVMTTDGKSGMHTLNNDLYRLYNDKRISRESAKKYTNDTKDLEQYLG